MADDNNGTFQDTSQQTSSAGLTLIGVDPPSSRQARYQTPEATTITPDSLMGATSTMPSLNTASTATENSGGQELQGAQLRLQDTLKGNTAVAQSIAGGQSAALDEMKASVSNSQYANKTWQEGIGQVGNYLQQQASAQQGQQLIQATQEIEDFRTRQAESGLLENGTGVARQELTQILSKYPNLAAKDVESLLKTGYEPIQAFANKTQEQLLSNMKEQRTKTMDIVSHQFGISLQTNLSALANPQTPNVQEVLGNLQQQITGFTQDPTLDPLTKLTSLSSAYTSIETALGTHDTKGQEALTHINDGMQFLQGNIDINAMIRAGVDKQGNPYTTEQGQAQLEALKLATHQSTTVGGIAYDYAENKRLEHERNVQTFSSLAEQRQITYLDSVHLNNASMGAAVFEAVTNEARYQYYKTNPVLSKSAFGKSIIGLADTFKKAQVERATLNQDAVKATQGLTAFNAQTTESLIQMSRGYSNTQMTNVSEGDATILGLLKQSQKQPLSQDEISTIASLRQQHADTYQALLQTYDDRRNALDAQLAPFGLNGDMATVSNAQQKNKGAIQSAYKALSDSQGLANDGSQATSYYNQGGKSGNKAPFDQPLNGAKGQMANPASFATSTYHGSQVILPFSRNAQASILDNYNQDRGDHTHAGIDLPVPIGTNVISPVNGRVDYIGNDPSGYGKFVDVVGDDGMRYRYAHLSSSSTHVGQTIGVGQTVALSGNSGDSEGPHVHFEIRKANAPMYGFDGTVDPLAYLQQQAKRGSNVFQPRGNYPQTYSASSGANSQSVTHFPSNAMPVPGGYFLNGSFFPSTDNVNPQPQQQSFNSTTPLRNGVMPESPKDYPPNDPHANYGYTALATNPRFASAVAKVSTEVGIPAVWLADMMSTESGTDASRPNKQGCVGLIQFCPGSTMGWTATQIANMSPEQQVLGPVRAYLKDIKNSIGAFRRPAELHLGIFGGAGNVFKLRQQGSGFNVSDSNIDRVSYVTQMLGASKGRKYRP